MTVLTLQQRPAVVRELGSVDVVAVVDVVVVVVRILVLDPRVVKSIPPSVVSFSGRFVVRSG